MPIITVDGIINENKLGVTLAHEHILVDLSCLYTEPEEVTRIALGAQKVKMSNLYILRRNPLALKDNLIINDINLAEEEIMKYKKAGGDSIVDVTNNGLGRDPIALRALSRAVGINIIMGSGYYHQLTHPLDMDKKSVEQITNEIINDINIGVGDTNIRAGVIGEIGISEEMHVNEKKVLISAAKASSRTGTGIQIHIFPWNKSGKFPLGLESLDILIKNGANPNKIAINHVDVAYNINIDYCIKICQIGAYAQFDNFGHEFYVDLPERKFLPGPFATDISRVHVIKKLIDLGFLRNILISNDICHKSLLHKYGGWGYDHILTNIIYMMKDAGITAEQINVILKENTKDFLNIKSPYEVKPN